MTSAAAAKALAECRERINALDLRLLELLNERTRIVEQIGRIKQECEMPNPTASGNFVMARIDRTSGSTAPESDSRSPVTPVRETR